MSGDVGESENEHLEEGAQGRVGVGGRELTDSSQAKETCRRGGRDGQGVVDQPMPSGTLEGAGATAGREGRGRAGNARKSIPGGSLQGAGSL